MTSDAYKRANAAKRSNNRAALKDDQRRGSRAVDNDDDVARMVLELLQAIASPLRKPDPTTIYDLDYERYVEQPRRNYLNQHKAAS